MHADACVHVQEREGGGKGAHRSLFGSCQAVERIRTLRLCFKKQAFSNVIFADKALAVVLQEQ